MLVFPSSSPTHFARDFCFFWGGYPQELPRRELWVLVAQLALSLILLICAAALAGFQSKWLGHPSGLSGFMLFVPLFSLVMTGILLGIPLWASKSPSKSGAARFLREARAGTILRAAPFVFDVFAAMAQAVSTGVSKGCKNHSQDPGQIKKGLDRKAYEKALSGFCASKVAASIFAWFLVAISSATLVLFLLAYRADRHGGQHHVPGAGGAGHGEHAAEEGYYARDEDQEDPERYGAGIGPKTGYEEHAGSRDAYDPWDAREYAEPGYEHEAYDFKHEPDSEMEEYAYYASRYGSAAVADVAGRPRDRSYSYGAYT